MYKIVSGILISAFACMGCSSYQPSISVTCEENDTESTVLKWETFPAIDGSLKVYASANPYNIPLERPIATTRISEQRLTISIQSGEQRMYYAMLFNDEFPVMTASRNIIIPGAQNFRDIGGYPTLSREKVTWGKIYRSAQLDSLNQKGTKVLTNLGIKTIIDLRGEEEHNGQRAQLKSFKTIKVPLYSKYLQSTLSRIQSGELANDSLHEIITLINIEIIDRNAKEFKKIFRALMDEKNYPVVIECTTGKMRTGLVTALLLKSLGVSDDIIMQDYELSNTPLNFNLTNSYKIGYSLPEPAQEALTTIYTSHGECLYAALDYLLHKYSSMDQYLHKQVGLSNKEIKKLKTILLQKRGS